MTAWPNIVTVEMWSFVFKHAIRIHNLCLLPSKDNKCPYKLFTSKAPLYCLSDFHVFGCPTYVLEKNLADDNSIPKWKACDYHSAYIGHSDQHSSSIAMIWNPITKLVSTQYHVIFDKGFQTVMSIGSTLDHDAIQAVFSTLLRSTEWLHSDKYATTNQMETQHYYFDNDSDLISCQGDMPQDQASPHCHKCLHHSSKQDSST